MLKHKLSGKSAFLPNKHNSQLGFCMTALTLGHHNSISKYFSFLVCGVFWIGVHTLPEVGLRQSKQSPEIGNTQSCPPTDLTRSKYSNTQILLLETPCPSVRHVFYPHLTRTHTNLMCERAR